MVGYLGFCFSILRFFTIQATNYANLYWIVRWSVQSFHLSENVRGQAQTVCVVLQNSFSAERVVFDSGVMHTVPRGRILQMDNLLAVCSDSWRHDRLTYSIR